MIAALFGGFTGIITIVLLVAAVLCLLLPLVLKGNAKCKIRSFTPYVVGALVGWVVITIVLYFIR